MLKEESRRQKEERGRQKEERGRLKEESGSLKEERRRQEEERGRLKEESGNLKEERRRQEEESRSMKEERGRQEEERGRLKGESGNLKEERRRQEEERGRLKGEDLRIRTKAFALQVLRLFAALPKETAAQILGRQLLRSGTAIGANYREAHRARSKAEFIAKTGICLAEVEETAYWLELLVEGDIVTRERLMELMDECNQLIAIFVTIVNKTKQKAER